MKTSIFLTTAALSIVLLMGCHRYSEVGTYAAADAIYTNGKIYTVNEAQPWAEAVVIKDGKFIAVGKNADILSYKGDNTQIVDLKGAFAMPGVLISI